jgi:putative membrane protein
MISLRRAEPDIVKGIVAGLVAGLAATWVKDKVQTKISEIQSSGEQQPSSSEEPSTVKAAEVVSEKVFQHELSDREKEKAGPAVDYSFGSAMGGLYGGLAEAVPEIRAGEGLAYGTGLWLVADEIGVPAAGLAKWPHKYPMSVHLNALAGHLVYGFTLEVVRRVFRRTLD